MINGGGGGYLRLTPSVPLLVQLVPVSTGGGGGGVPVGTPVSTGRGGGGTPKNLPEVGKV